MAAGMRERAAAARESKTRRGKREQLFFVCWAEWENGVERRGIFGKWNKVEKQRHGPETLPESDTYGAEKIMRVSPCTHLNFFPHPPLFFFPSLISFFLLLLFWRFV